MCTRWTWTYDEGNRLFRGFPSSEPGGFTPMRLGICLRSPCLAVSLEVVLNFRLSNSLFCILYLALFEITCAQD